MVRASPARKSVKKAPKTRAQKSQANYKPTSGTAQTFKLRIELVPEPLWKKNLRSPEFGLGDHGWKKLRQEILETEGPRCAICGDTERPHGHEVWKYAESKEGQCVAKLMKVEIVCRRCHDIHHWGRTRQLIEQGKMSPEAEPALREHFCRVNNCTEEDFDLHSIRAFAEHRERSKKNWIVDWGEFVADVAIAVANRAARIAPPFSFD